LDRFFVKIVFLSRSVVGSHDSDFLSGGDCSGEDSSEGEESGFIGGGHHLGDVHHKRSFGVAVFDGLSTDIIDGSFVEIAGSVFLGGLGRR